MYNGIGLQTARGSGTNGYVQTNKFFVRPRNARPDGAGKGFSGDQGTGGVTRKANRDILEHDRRRQIQLKLVVLEDKLADQGYTEAEIREKLDETRRLLEAADAAEAASGGVAAAIATDKKVSDTQTHQIAARKEKKMEAFRAALGISMSEPDSEKKQSETPYSDSEEGEVHDDEEARNSQKKGPKEDVRLHEEDAKEEKIDKRKDLKGRKTEGGRGGHGKARSKVQDTRRREHVDDSSDSDSSSEYMQGTKKKYVKSGQYSDDSDSDVDVAKKKRQKSASKQESRRRDSDISESDEGEIYEKNRKHHALDEDGSSSDEQRKRITQKEKRHSKLSRRHDSDSNSDSDSDKETRKNEIEWKKNALTESHRTEKEKPLSSDHQKIINERHGKSRARNHVESDSDSGRARKDKKDKEKSRRRHLDRNHVESDSDSGRARKDKKDKEKSRRRHLDADDSDSGYDKKIEKTHISRRHDTDDDESDDSKSGDLNGRSDSDSDDSDYRQKKIDRSKSEEKNRGRKRDDMGSRGEQKKHESSVVEKRPMSSAVEQNDRRNKRSGTDNAHDGLDTFRKLEELHQSRRETVDEARYGSQETMRGKRKVDGEHLDEMQPEAKSRSRNVGKEAGKTTGKEQDIKKVEAETKSTSRRDKDDQRRDDYSRLNRSARGHEVENIDRGTRIHGRSELHRDSKRGDRDFEERGEGKRHNRDEDEPREVKHTRDEGDVYGRHRKDEDRYHGSRRRGREEEEERGAGRRDERDRQVDTSKRVKYDDSRSSERGRYDDGKRDDGRSRR